MLKETHTKGDYRIGKKVKVGDSDREAKAYGYFRAEWRTERPPGNNPQEAFRATPALEGFLSLSPKAAHTPSPAEPGETIPLHSVAVF